jgi:hypothetical protein
VKKILSFFFEKKSVPSKKNKNKKEDFFAAYDVNK